MTHIIACALYCNPDGSLNGLGTAAARALGIPFGLALFAGAIRVLTGNYGNQGRRR